MTTNYNPLETLLKILTIFVTVIIVSIIIYSFVFGYVSYNTYLTGYGYQNWCSEDYSEFASIRFHYLSQMPNIVSPLFTFVYIGFFIYSLYQFRQYAKKNRLGDISSTYPLMGSSAARVLSYGLVISMLGVMIANQVKPLNNYKEILNITLSVAFPVLWLIVLIISYFDEKEKKLNHFQLAEYIVYAAYIFILLYLLFYIVNVDAHKIENVIKHSWIIAPLIASTLAMLMFNNNNFDINNDVALQKILEFYVFIIGVLIGIVLFDKAIAGPKQKEYKKNMMRLNLTISKLLGQDIEIKGVSAEPLTSIELSSLYPGDNISFINLFAKTTNNNSKGQTYEEILDPQIKANDTKLRSVRVFMKIFADKLLEIVNGTIECDKQDSDNCFISKDDINNLRLYNSVHSKNPKNALSSLREEFIYYIKNADRIDIDLLSENSRYSEFVDPNMLHRIVLDEHNHMNPSTKDISRIVLRSFYITDGTNDYRFYFVGGSIDAADIFEKSPKIKAYNIDRNNKKIFTDEDDMLEELANIIDTTNLPCAYLSYYNGDFEKFKIKLENLKYNVKKIDQEMEKEIKESYGYLENDSIGIRWSIMLFSLIMALIVIYLIFVNVFAYTNMASTIILVMIFILVFILSYSVKIIVNNQ